MAVKITSIILITFLLALFLALAFGGPTNPKLMHSINDPFASVDFSDLPPYQYVDAKDGTPLAFRHYQPSNEIPRSLVMMIHGSAGSSSSLHKLAKALSRKDFGVYVLDVRGHGKSGSKGIIDYVGQLEDDLETFAEQALPDCDKTLLGFSSGGGFALRVASGEHSNLFNHYLLLSPFLHQDAPSHRQAAGGWVNVGLPRAIALELINHIGFTLFNDLPVLAFAVEADNKDYLTPWYAYNLAKNFRPENDYLASIKRVKHPLQVLVGENDEVFKAEAFQPVFEANNSAIEVRVVSEVNHIGLTLDQAGIDAVIQTLLNQETQPKLCKK